MYKVHILLDRGHSYTHTSRHRTYILIPALSDKGPYKRLTACPLSTPSPPFLVHLFSSISTLPILSLPILPSICPCREHLSDPVTLALGGRQGGRTHRPRYRPFLSAFSRPNSPDRLSALTMRL